MFSVFFLGLMGVVGSSVVDESADQMQDPVNTDRGPWWLGEEEWKGKGWRDSWDDLNKAMERGIVVLMCCWEAKCGEEGSRAVVGR